MFKHLKRINKPSFSDIETSRLEIPFLKKVRN